MKKGRTSRLTIRLTPDEYKHFLVLQRNSGLSQADFIMNAIDNIPPPDKDLSASYNNLSKRLNELSKEIQLLNPNFNKKGN